MARKSSFDKLGLKKSIEFLIEEVKELYKSDNIPWVVGYSGGKDSTATLQLVWSALQQLPKEELHKTVHVISTDTLVENPIVAMWVKDSLSQMGNSAKEQNLPIVPHRLTPTIGDSFWVNLIGKGYPAPRQRFRWCTMRLKIFPSNNFIKTIVHQSGEAIVVLGIRKAESSSRSKIMNNLEQKRKRDHLSPNASLANSFVYSPIESWTDDDVWAYLMQYENTWGVSNKNLLTMYQGASADGECPLVVDTNTPSCGDSRFGCWICTLVDKDKSMSAMIQNDEEKEWMLPLLDFRDELDFRGEDKKALELTRRDFRRMDGNVHYNKYSDGTIHGPYTQQARAEWLEKLLMVQKWIQDNAPPEVVHHEIITLDELREIRRIWIVEKHEFEDLLPPIYNKVMGQIFPDSSEYNNLLFSSDDLNVLKSICDNDEIQYQMLRELLDIERHYQTSQRRAGLFESLEKAIKKGFFADEDDASAVARKKHRLKSNINDFKENKELSAIFELLNNLD